MSGSGRAWAHRYAAIGLISCSMLTYEILLTRVCALRLFFHFAFLVISNCLLGIGASGTLLALYQDRLRLNPRLWLARFCLLYLASSILTYAILLTYPLPTDLRPLADHLGHLLLLLAGFNLLAAVPFLFGGLVVGMLLSFGGDRANRLYAVDLLGAGLGCLACPLFLAHWGAGGAFVLVALLALVSALVAMPPPRGRAVLAASALAGVLGLWLLPTLDQRFPVPSKGVIDLARNVQVETQQADAYTVWTANSRIDLIDRNQGFIYLRGTAIDGLPPIPEQKLILQDAAAGTFIVNWSEHPEALVILERSLYSAAFSLKQSPKVFIIGLGGGNDAWAAKAMGARFIKAVELNEPILDIHREVLPRYSMGLLDDPKIELVVGEGRSVLMRESELYDVIQMTGIDTWTALRSGAYVLAENYLYTREALDAMYLRLAPGGILQITRFAADMEALRMVSNIWAMLGRPPAAEFAPSIIALATPDELMAILLKKGEFSEGEVQQLYQFTADNGIRRVYLPSGGTGGVVEQFILSDEKERFIDEFPRDISPTSDDRPYFFNFSKWRDPLASRRYVREPTSVAQGNPFLLLSHLSLSVVFGLVLILLPLTRLGRLPRVGEARYLAYFSGLGLGFIAIEVSLLQKLTVFLGHPIYSITVTLFSLLTFTGLGSLLLAGRIATDDRRIWAIPLGVMAFLIGCASFSANFVSAFIELPLPARIALTIALLAPVGLLLGVPFAYGLRVLNERNPALIPWAWAVNGCLSVVGSIVTAILSMNFGFNAVLLLAGGIYLVAFLALRREVCRAVASA